LLRSIVVRDQLNPYAQGVCGKEVDKGIGCRSAMSGFTKEQ